MIGQKNGSWSHTFASFVDDEGTWYYWNKEYDGPCHSKKNSYSNSPQAG